MMWPFLAAFNLPAAHGYPHLSQSYQQCFLPYRCGISATINGTAYAWDLSPLCRRQGSEYSLGVGGMGNVYWSFNVCGLVSYACIPDTWSDPYAHGIAHQYIEGPPAQVLTPGNPGCKGTATDPDTGQQVCTTECAMAAAGVFNTWELANWSDPYGGIVGLHAGVPPDANAPFDCPYDSTEGCSGSRSLTFLFACDPAGDVSTLSDLSINETSVCKYVISGSTKAACPANPSPSPTPSPTATATFTAIPTTTATVTATASQSSNMTASASPSGPASEGIITQETKAPVAYAIGFGGVCAGIVGTLAFVAMWGRLSSNRFRSRGGYTRTPQETSSIMQASQQRGLQQSGVGPVAPGPGFSRPAVKEWD